MGRYRRIFLSAISIAVEARRLNQMTPIGYRGLEEVSKPLLALFKKALLNSGPPVDGKIMPFNGFEGWTR
jgi:hypothetical protein